MPFASAEFSCHLANLGVQQNVAPPNTHFCVGAAGKAVGRIKTQLHLLSNTEGTNWFPILSRAVYNLNKSVIPDIKCSPFVALHGFTPRLCIDNFLPPVRNRELHDKMRQQALDREQLRVDLVHYRSKMKRHYDARHPPVEFQPGDLTNP
ncbi:hypothetical protein ONE63_011116 [Megalurothrips usitatus]|uniref:Uncharacterized protein n=1 Tax=Megalurothrips usitatus TaxID=439358 RepID=A0AAV7XJ54_9NEOP|nr:hypothetical protein ONE63_011116 [Megalurothrips usitatus]